MTKLTLIAGNDEVLTDAPFIGRHLIGGVWRDSADSQTFDRVSPSHKIVVSRSALGGIAETDAAIAAARAAFNAGLWSRISGKARAAVLLRVADLIEDNVERMARLETLESGKPISQSRGEVSGAADLWRYAASLARTLHGDSHNTLGPDMLGVVLKEPIGVVSIITPWNFPFWILSQKLPFALAAGCTCVVKPSELTPSTTALLGDLLTVLLAPYDDLGAFSGRIRVAVPRMGVGERSATTLALVMHELATNSLKYGALSAETGTLDISCLAEETDAVVVWTESGGPSVVAPQGDGGFGSKLVARSMAAQLGGSIEHDWAAGGLIVTLRMRKERLRG